MPEYDYLGFHLESYISGLKIIPLWSWRGRVNVMNGVWVIGSWMKMKKLTWPCLLS